jgi:hypothetical protein
MATQDERLQVKSSGSKGRSTFSSGGAEKWDFRAPERSVLPVREHRSTEKRALQARMG